MSRFGDVLLAARQNKKLTLIASLPRNDPELARAALNGGADVVKVHINIHHHASNTHFGSLAEERKNLETILKLWQSKPVGIVPFAVPENDSATYAELAKMGFDFYSLYFRNAVVGCFPQANQMGRMLALAVDDPIDLAEGLDRLPMDVCELSIMHGDTYGQPLTYHDLLRYAAVRSHTHLPLVVPSQHVILPTAVPELIGLGIEGLMIGTVCAGTTPADWIQSMQAFRKAIDNVRA